MLTGRRFRMELTADQMEYAELIGSACRVVWNTGLEQRREYRRRGAWMNYYAQSKELTEAKADHRWLAEAPAHCLQQTLMDLEQACRQRGTFKVRWRSGRRWSPSFRIPDGKLIRVERLNRRHARVKLPKLGWVKFRMSRLVDDSSIRSATVSREGDEWYISFVVEDGVHVSNVHVNPDSAVGIDRGIAHLVTTSDGEFIDTPRLRRGEGRRGLNLQRKISRSKRASANRMRARRAYARVRAHDRYRRKDFSAKIASHLAGMYSIVALEDLNAQKMSEGANHDLNRLIRSMGWRQFEDCLNSSARYTGTRVVKVNPAYTSQRCSQCQHVDPKSRESQAVFRCTNCGHSEHADVNAAKNILAAGLAATACGDFLPLGTSTKQEPAGKREQLLPQH